MKCLINCSAVIVFTVDMFLCRAMYISNPYLSQLHMEFVKAFQIWEKIYVAFEPLVSHIHHSEVCHNSEVHIDEECELCNKKKDNRRILILFT